MVAYTDIDFYMNHYGANQLSNKEIVERFDYYAIKATQFIKMYTWDNVDENDIPECVKMCCCELIGYIASNDEKQASFDTGVRSESVGGWSRTYADASELQEGNRAQLKHCVYEWLTGTGLLYRGVR